MKYIVMMGNWNPAFNLLYYTLLWLSNLTIHTGVENEPPPLHTIIVLNLIFLTSPNRRRKNKRCTDVWFHEFSQLIIDVSLTQMILIWFFAFCHQHNQEERSQQILCNIIKWQRTYSASLHQGIITIIFFSLVREISLLFLFWSRSCLSNAVVQATKIPQLKHCASSHLWIESQIYSFEKIPNDLHDTIAMARMTSYPCLSFLSYITYWATMQTNQSWVLARCTLCDSCTHLLEDMISGFKQQITFHVASTPLIFFIFDDKSILSLYLLSQFTQYLM